MLRQLDKQRLLTWAATQQPQAHGAQAAGDAAAGVLSTHQLFALFELLGYSHYLDDAELCDAAVRLLQHVNWALETSEGTPYAGLFRLLAHPDAGVRSKVRTPATHWTVVLMPGGELAVKFSRRMCLLVPAHASMMVQGQTPVALSHKLC